MAYRTTSWKNTDIGKIPSDWDVKKLGEIGIFDTCSGKSQYQDTFGKYLIVDMGAVSSDGKLIACKYSNYAHDFLKTGELVMPKDDIGGGLIIGKTAVIPENNRYIMGDHVFKITVLDTENPYFISAMINSDIVSKNIHKLVTGSAQLGLAKSNIKRVTIKVPTDKLEQTAIADVLTDIDDLIAELECVRDKKIAIKTGVMQELLRPKECWISKKLDKVCDNIFAGGTPSTANEEFWKNGDIIWLPSGMVQDAVIERRNAKDRITAKGLANSSAKLIKAGTTILAMTGATCGKVAYLPFEAAANQSVMAFETTKISSKFLFYLLLNNKDYVLQFQAGGAQAGINKTSCKNFEFSFPSTKLEQEKIAQILSDMDNEISAISDKINKYKQIKSGVAGELLSGRIRLVKPQE